MNNKNKIIALVAVLAVVSMASVGVVKAKSGGFWDKVIDKVAIVLAGSVEAPDVNYAGELLGGAGDTYQTAKVYSKVIASATTIPANIPCDGWLIKGIDFYVAPSTTLATATTSITIGIYANATTTTVESSLATDTFSTSTAVYQTYVTADGAGVTCASGKYVGVVFGAVATTTSGVLNVEYLKYE